MAKWEYTVTTLMGNEAPKQVEALNKLGKNGWELIAIVGSGENPAMVTAYLKRELTSKMT